MDTKGRLYYVIVSEGQELRNYLSGSGSASLMRSQSKRQPRLQSSEGLTGAGRSPSKPTEVTVGHKSLFLTMWAVGEESFPSSILGSLAGIIIKLT